jgi:hypothetical protein
MASIRVWHSNPKGDDYYYRFKSLAAAKAHIRTHKTAERTATILHKGKEYAESEYSRLRKSATKRKKQTPRKANAPFGMFGFGLGGAKRKRVGFW